MVTVLSIDGGGIRGIIPGILLGFLESKLQRGRSGVACASPRQVASDAGAAAQTPHPCFPDLWDKYRWASHCHAYSSRQGEPTHVCCKGHHQHLFRALSQDFSPEQAQKFCGLNSFAAVVGPKYDGKYLRSLTDGLLGNLTLKQTLTDVIIPTFDIKLLQPVIFSTYDIFASAPLLRPLFFRHATLRQRMQAETLRVSTSLTVGLLQPANNPTMMAISQIFKGRFKNEFMSIRAMDYSKRMLVLSLGTGAAKHEEKYSTTVASKWGLINWLYDNGATPLLDVYGDASSDMVDFHVSTLFQALGCKNNYLRIQENLQRLVEIGKELLKKPVSRVNLDTGRGRLGRMGSLKVWTDLYTMIDAIGKACKLALEELDLQRPSHRI
ncbi:hypothetical protein ACJW30_02G166900 [Castanea mollissima]